MDRLRDKVVFFGLSDDQLGKIAGVAEERSYAKGDTIFWEGDAGDALFIVEKGSVDIVLEKQDGSRIDIATLAAGAVIGEVTLVNVEPRSASAVAAGEPTLLLELSHEATAKIFREDQDLLVTVLLNITRILSTRLRRTDQRLLYSNGT